jgi:hypothetical protein
VSPVTAFAGRRADVKLLGVAVVAQLMSTPCNRFLDDGFNVALLITKGKIRFFW